MKITKLLMLLFCALFTSFLFTIPSHVFAGTLGKLDPSHVEPTGNPNVSYPQISIRTNRTPQRTDLNAVITAADKAASQYPMSDQQDRAKSVSNALVHYFGSGDLGHTWIIIFHSNKPGDYTSYGFHEGSGFVKHGKSDIDSDGSQREFREGFGILKKGKKGQNSDGPQRGFCVEKTLPINDAFGTENNLETKIIPQLIQESDQIATAMGLPVLTPNTGVYTPVNNCSWFAGNVWNAATGDSLAFEQPFNGAAHATNWGMPILNNVNKVGDPGMVSESINSSIKDTNGKYIQPGKNYFIKINSTVGTSYFNTPSESFYKPNWTYLINTVNDSDDSKYQLENTSNGYKIYSLATKKYLKYFTHNILYPNGGIDTGAKDGSINWKFVDTGNNTYSFTADDGGVLERLNGSNHDLVTTGGSGTTNFKIQFVSAN